MAQEARSSGGWKMPVQDAGGNPMGIMVVGEGTSNAATVLVFEVQGTSYYLWVDATGDLRVGTTKPTAGSLTGTGTVVGSQS
jgi:hypothetical protein